MTSAAAHNLELGARGIRGNGHMMMMERNSDQIGQGMAWIERGTFPSAKD